MDQRKHVLMLVERYRPAVGGVEKHLENLFKTLGSQHYRFTVLTASHRKGLRPFEERDECTIIRIPHGQERSPIAVWRYIRSVAHQITPCDILHVHDVTPLVFWWIPLVSLIPKRPFMTFHGYEQDPVPLVWKLIRHLADRIAEDSLCIGRFIEDIYGISCGHMSLGAVHERDGSSSESKGLVYVGRLESDTGIMTYIQALRYLREKYNLKIPLTVCGGGSLMDEIDRISRREDLDIVLTGVVDDPAGSIDGRLASLSPGYLSILESMMMGVPVIGVATTYLRHRYLLAVRRAGGPISIQTSAQGVAEEIRRLYEDSGLRTRLAKRARDFSKQYTWERLADEYITMWKR